MPRTLAVIVPVPSLLNTTGKLRAEVFQLPTIGSDPMHPAAVTATKRARTAAIVMTSVFFIYTCLIRCVLNYTLCIIGKVMLELHFVLY